jgi:hypothetical protein
VRSEHELGKRVGRRRADRVLFLSFLVFSDFATQASSWADAATKSNDVYLRPWQPGLRRLVA